MVRHGRIDLIGRAQRAAHGRARHLIAEIEAVRAHHLRECRLRHFVPVVCGTSRTTGRYRIMAPRTTQAPHSFSHMLTSLGVLTARPIAFVIFGVFIAAWIVFDHESLKWHELATLATW